jgi:RHS repeat-associated protein
LTQVVYPDKTYEKYTYDEEGNISSFTNRDSKTVYYTYDAMNSLESIVYQDGSTVKYEYNGTGEIKKVTDQRGNSTEYQYDSLGRLEYVFNSAKPDEKIQYIYTTKPYPDEMLDAKGNRFIYSYNSNGKLEVIKYSDNTTYEMKYDAAGRLSTVKDQNGKVTKYDYDDAGNVEKVTLAYGIEGKEETWVYAYDEAGNLKSITDPRLKETKMEYDSVGRLKKQILPLKMYLEASYNDDKKEVTVTDYNKNSIVYKYDNNMRLDVKEVGAENTVDFDYTNEGYVKKVVDKNGTTSYEYDDLYRLIKRTNPDNSTIEYFYDWTGNCTGVKTKGGATSYVYDVYNRLSKVIANDNKTTQYLYDAVGNLEYILHQDGYKTQYIYDDQNRLTDVKRIKPDGKTVEYSYHYDLGYAGERKKVTESNGRIVEYDYDDCYRLKEEKITDPVLGNRVITYKYDKAGNRLEKNDNGIITVYDPDDNNRIISEGSNKYIYDDNGNLKTKVEGNSTTTYAYDGENRLISVTQTESGTTNVETYEYDWEGNRISKTTNGVVTKYLVDSNGLAQVIEELDGNDNLLVYYTYGNDLISQTRSGVTSYFQYDGLGSTRRLTDEDGNVTDTYVYDAFGNILNRTGTTENSYMFAGEQYDANSGFYYLRARYMNPAIGNFITMDPYSGSLYDPTSLHKYLYANASPVNFIDPTGYFSIPEMLVSFDINGVIGTIRCVSLSALRNAAIGAVSGAVFGGIDAKIGGRNVIEGVIKGSISGAAFGALATFSELRLILGVFGVKGGVEGVFTAIEEGNYNLAAWRAATTIWAIMSLKSELFNKSACFTEDTLIYTKDGYKEIKDIEVGDEVYSENPETGEQGLKRVLNVFVNTTKELIHLKVGDQEIKTTSNHPFWVEGIGWGDAGDLKPGDRLVMYSGEILEVKEAFVEYLDKPIKVYNFEVEDWHTYFVTEYNVFVHNADCGGNGGKPGRSDHAEKRRTKDGRPVSAGRSDAQNAKRSEIYVQDDGRWVVKGDNGRLNVFEPNGEHVTTFKNPQKNTDMRVRSGRYSRLTEAQYEEFSTIFNNKNLGF